MDYEGPCHSAEYDMLINPEFHQTIQTSVVHKVHVCFEVFSD